MKKGDKARVISKDGSPRHYFKINEEVEYLGLQSGDDYKFKEIDGIIKQWLSPNQFEPIKDLEKEKQELEQRLKQINQELEKPKFEIGKWYAMHIDNKTIGVINFQGDLKNKNYGFWRDKWRTDLILDEGYGFKVRPATHEEVEKALIKQWEKENKPFDNYTWHSPDGWGGWKNRLYGLNKGGDTVKLFDNGKWAKIIEEPKVILNGYEMQQDGEYIIFGCAKFHRFYLNQLFKWCKTGSLTWSVDDQGNPFGATQMSKKEYPEVRRIKSITLDSGVEITIDEFEQIVDNIE